MFSREKIIRCSTWKLSNKLDKLNDAENVALFNEIDTNYNAKLQKIFNIKKDSKNYQKNFFKT